MSQDSFDYLKDVFSSPLGDFIASIGEGVGEAQAALDEGSLRQTLEIYNTDPDNADASLRLLREIGYQPTFYTLPKTTAKAKISLSISQQNNNNVLNNGKVFKTKMYATPLNASNVNKYNLNLNASAELTFDIVPVPPADNQLIRLLPNVIEKTVEDTDGNITLVPRTFAEIKTLLTEYDLSYAFATGTNEEDITDESTFTTQLPVFDENQEKIIRINDVIILGV